MSRKKEEGETTTVSVVMDWKLHKEIKEEALRDRRTISAECLELIEMGLKVNERVRNAKKIVIEHYEEATEISPKAEKAQ